MPKAPKQALNLLSQLGIRLASRLLPNGQMAQAQPLGSPSHQPSFAAAASEERLENLFQIPIRTDCTETARRMALHEQGQFLARQDRWGELSNLMQQTDQAQSKTTGGLAEAEVLAFGARADVINAVEHALSEPGAETERSLDDKVLLSGVMSLEALRRDHADDPYITTLVALAHIDIAWIWRTNASDAGSGELYLRRAMAHFDRAAALLAPLRNNESQSPFILAALCALYSGQSEDCLQVADAYAALIDYDPRCHRHIRGLGLQMLPRANGSYAALELEARRVAVRTQSTWGAGGYTWTYFDAIAIDDQACARVDVKFFLDGIQDILCADPSQEMINMLTAYCTVTLQKEWGSSEPADQTRQEIAQSACWLARNHMRELHPLIWAHAAKGFDNSARVPSLNRFAAHGKAQALECLASIFQEEISSGHRVAFTKNGFDLMSA